VIVMRDCLTLTPGRAGRMTPKCSIAIARVWQASSTGAAPAGGVLGHPRGELRGDPLLGRVDLDPTDHVAVRIARVGFPSSIAGWS